jgi:hypothetical protein
MARSRVAQCRNLALLFLCGLLLLACANRPESIRASYVAYEKYVDLDCQAMGAKMAETRAQLARYSDLQNSKANGDAFGVFLLGIPFSKLTGDVEGDVARLKGEVEAIETAEIRKKCGSTPATAARDQRAPGSPVPGGGGLLPAGASWSYTFSDRIYAANNTKVTITVLRADSGVVEEQLVTGPDASHTTVARREIAARSTRFDAYRIGASETLVEFAPYLFAAGGEAALRGVADPAGYPTSSMTGWTTKVEPLVWDQVTCPAGSFRALRLEITGEGRVHDARQYSQTFTVRIWYAPEVKRYVRLEHKVWRDEQLYGDEAVELVGFDPHT